MVTVIVFSFGRLIGYPQQQGGNQDDQQGGAPPADASDATVASRSNFAYVSPIGFDVLSGDSAVGDGVVYICP